VIHAKLVPERVIERPSNGAAGVLVQPQRRDDLALEAKPSVPFVSLLIYPKLVSSQKLAGNSGRVP
jgi:hypothetical protein